MTHDPLCSNQPEHYDGSVLWPAHCECSLIAKVRADERHAAVQRVEALAFDHENGHGVLIVPTAEVIAAIKGGNE